MSSNKSSSGRWEVEHTGKGDQSHTVSRGPQVHYTFLQRSCPSDRSFQIPLHNHEASHSRHANSEPERGLSSQPRATLRSGATPYVIENRAQQFETRPLHPRQASLIPTPHCLAKLKAQMYPTQRHQQFLISAPPATVTVDNYSQPPPELPLPWASHPPS